MRNTIVALLTAFSILLSMSEWCGCAEVYAGDIRLYAKSAVLMDADSGRVLYERNGYEQMAMASTTKIMTLIVTQTLTIRWRCQLMRHPCRMCSFISDKEKITALAI